jgi:hypothetical protein
LQVRGCRVAALLAMTWFVSVREELASLQLQLPRRFDSSQ